MKEEVKHNPSGKIKSKIFALVVLALSLSLGRTAIKSLARSFDGMIMHKEIHSGFIQKKYDLYINTDYQKTSNPEITNKDAINVLLENFDDYVKVGVSYFAYQEAAPTMVITKKSYSPIIALNGANFIDQGLFWLFMSFMGGIISVVIYRQTLTEKRNQDSGHNN